MNKKFLFFISILLLICLSLPVKNLVSAEETAEEDDGTEKIEDLQDKIEEYEEKIEDLQSEAQTLSREIESADAQINLTALKIQNAINNIAKTEKAILKLTGDIEDLSERIDTLIERVAYQQDVLKERIRERYKTRETSPMMVIFGTDTVNDLVKKASYLRVMEIQDNKVIVQMNNTKDTFNKQKSLFEEKKDEEEALKVQLIQEKSNLDYLKIDLENKKEDKRKLLEVTNNDEQKYQELLAKAKRELDSYSSFVVNSGQGVIGPNGLGGGEGGWYYSQRDSRWAYDKIGNSPYNVYYSGCLVTSVAMIHKYYGYDVNPGDIADEDGYFFWGDMLIPWPGPGGRNYTYLGSGFPKSAIDKELDKDNPVIVGVTANNSAGTHFIVLLDGEDGDYEMHDPIYGPNLDFGDYYSTTQIFQAVVFK